LSGGYTFGDAKVVALYQTTRDNLGIKNLDQKMWGLGGSYKMDSNTIKAQYYKAKSLDLNGSLDDTAGSMWALGLDHAMSKRTTAYVAYSRSSNDTYSTYSAAGGGHGDTPTVLAGKNTGNFSLGMIHNF
jgi:predicted porin